MTLIRPRVRTEVRDRGRRPRNFVPAVDGLDKRIAPGAMLPPPPTDGTCEPSTPTS